MCALPRTHGHHRDQDQVLRGLLCLQGLPLCSGRSQDRGLARDRMGRAGDTLRSLRHRVNHPPVHAGRISVPGLPWAVQSWVSKPLSLLFRNAILISSQISDSRQTSNSPINRPESMPNVEITSHKPICGPKILLRPIIRRARLILQAASFAGAPRQAI